MPFEFALLNALQMLHAPALDSIMVAVSTLGNAGTVWLVLGAVLLAFRRTRRLGVAVIVAVGLAFLACVAVVKPLVARPRPCDVVADVPLLVPRPHGDSFPSGHTSAAFAALGALAFASAPRRLTVPVLAAACLMGFSRLYLYVHFPTDVLAGAALGLACGFVAVRFVDALARRRGRATGASA